MGRGNKKRNNKFVLKRRDRGKGEKTNVRPERAEPYKDIVKENDAFFRYYQHVKICDENEWEGFLQSLRSDLPVTFRISGSKKTAKRLLDLIQNEFFTKYIQSAAQDEANKHPICLPWYPNQMAWQLELSRKDIRRMESHFKLHNFLIAETNSGSISRQEAVSMIPPIVLDVKPHHKVLDMCAAPGSKTAQLIESLHATDNPMPEGFVVANDVDNNRCYMLVHQAKRLNSPCFIVINQDSSCMPPFKTIDGNELRFDRILCDVPCTGDGTLRKNPDIWNKWHLGHSLNLHGVQYRIARRGAELLEVGGRLVYSTCSLNPVENEAVISRLLRDSDGSLELVDATNLVPGLKYAPGLFSWDLADKECKTFYQSFDQVPETLHTVIRPQMFPPSADELVKFSLDKCMRILPHFQNTGGFFVAVLTKKSELPWERRRRQKKEAETETEADTTTASDAGDATNGPPKQKKRRIWGFKEDPFVFFEKDEPTWQGIKTFYDIDVNSAVAFDSTQLLTRSLTGKKKNIYVCSRAVKQLVQGNEDRIKVINMGVKVFARCDHRNMQCEFRLANEGLDTIDHLVGHNRRVEVNKEDFISLLFHTDPKNPLDFDLLSDQTKERLQKMESGSVLVVFRDHNDDFTLNAVGWKGAKSLRAYIDLNDSIHLLRLLGADVSKFEVNKFQKKDDDVDTTSDPKEVEEKVENVPDEGSNVPEI